MLGVEQEAWLLDGLRRSHATWNVLAQQVFFSQLDLLPGPGRRASAGTRGTATSASRDRVVVGAAATPEQATAVVLTGDMHRHCAAEITERFDDPSSPTVATELVSSSITLGRGRVGRPDPRTARLLADNPHVQLLQQPPRLRPGAGRRQRDARRLPGRALRVPARRAGGDRRLVRDRERSARAGARLIPCRERRDCRRLSRQARPRSVATSCSTRCSPGSATPRAPMQ